MASVSGGSRAILHADTGAWFQGPGDRAEHRIWPLSCTDPSRGKLVAGERDAENPSVRNPGPPQRVLAKGCLSASRRNSIHVFGPRIAVLPDGAARFSRTDRVFRDWMLRLDDIPRRLSGRSVIEVLYSGVYGKGDRFERTLLTHPAIFMVEYSLAEI